MSGVRLGALGAALIGAAVLLIHADHLTLAALALTFGVLALRDAR